MSSRIRAALGAGIAVGLALPAGADAQITQVDPQAAPQSGTQTVTIRFAGKVGDLPFACGSSYDLGQPAMRLTPTDFRLYLSNVALINQQGQAVPLTLVQDGKWQHQNIALLDFEDKTGACTNGTAETRREVMGTVPVDVYRGLQFTLGLPFALNHADATLAPSPLNLTSLWWNWRGGYKFARIDLAMPTQAALPSQTGTRTVGSHAGPVAHGADHGAGHGSGHGAEKGGLAIHLGSTGCEAASTSQAPSRCSNPNTAQILLAEFDPAQNTVVADLAALLTDSNLAVNQPDTPPGCMSSPDDGDCAGIFRGFGLPFRGQPSTGQTFFRME